MAGHGRRRLVAVAALVVLAGAAALALHAPPEPRFAEPADPALRITAGLAADAGYTVLSGPVEHTVEAVAERPNRSPVTGPLDAVLGLATLVPLLLLVGRMRGHVTPIGAPWRAGRPGSPRAPPVGR